jgi:hypothetical protein
MDPLLLGVTLISLALAIAMAIVAVKLLRGSRQQSEARVQALHALIASASSRDVEVDDRPPAAEPTHGPLEDFDLEPPLEPADAAPLRANHVDSPPETAPVPPPAAPPAPPPAPIAVPVFATPASMTMTTQPRAAPETLSPEPEGSHDESWDLALRPRRPAPPKPAVTVSIRPSRPAAPRRQSIATAEPLFEPPEQRTPSHRWSALAAVALVMAAVIGAVYVMATRDVVGSIAQAFSGRGSVATTNAGAAPLELLSLRHSTEAGEFVLTGLVQNPPAGVSLRGVVAVVYLFDRENQFFASGKAALEVPILASGAEAPFVIRVPGVSGISRYRVGFRHQDGAVVAHVDRRGELPGGTTGATVEGERIIDRAPTGTRVIG